MPVHVSPLNLNLLPRVPSSISLQLPHMETPCPSSRFTPAAVQTPVPPATPLPHPAFVAANTPDVRTQQSLADSWAQAMVLVRSDNVDQVRCTWQT